MEKKKTHNTEQEIKWQIRNNVRKGNFSRVSELVMSVLKRDNSDESKQDLMEFIYKDTIKPCIESDKTIPKQYEGMLLEYARYEQSQENLERTLKVLEAIKESENSKTRKKVNRQINLINLSQELSKGDDINVELVEKITEDIEKGADSRTYMELISSIFGKEFSIDKLSLGELEKYIVDKHRKPSDEIADLGKVTYPEELQVENRMRFLKEELDIDSSIRFCDKGIFAGSILLGLKDTDWILVEKVIDMYADGTYELNNYGSATYILPRDKMLDLIKLQTKEKVKTQLKDVKIKGIAPIQHRENWKKNIKNAIEQIKNLSKEEAAVTHEHEQVEENQETKTVEPVTHGIERILEDMTQNDNSNPIIMNVVRKIQELLSRIAELDTKQQQANNDLQSLISEEERVKEDARDKIAAKEKAEKELEEAKRKEQEASALAKQAIDAEQEVVNRKQATEEKQKKLAEEKAKIQEKLEEIEKIMEL